MALSHDQWPCGFDMLLGLGQVSWTNNRLNWAITCYWTKVPKEADGSVKGRYSSRLMTVNEVHIRPGPPANEGPLRFQAANVDSRMKHGRMKTEGWRMRLGEVAIRQGLSAWCHSTVAGAIRRAIRPRRRRPRAAPAMVVLSGSEGYLINGSEGYMIIGSEGHLIGGFEGYHISDFEGYLISGSEWLLSMVANNGCLPAVKETTIIALNDQF
ncbi:hypothetical protein E3N88_17643 [Mikania micrantha]|uniref:Uncharacterized protein n=1 Tax=Mikania micrantha TaxID=192012 RepID=A0A5N6NVG9_9ASTR|nr:hypothetical protein E3N88_17643 [Mikania micrantha]